MLRSSNADALHFCCEGFIHVLLACQSLTINRLGTERCVGVLKGVYICMLGRWVSVLVFGVRQTLLWIFPVKIKTTLTPGDSESQSREKRPW